MEFRVAIIGLGYVGLPLAVEAGKTYATTGFDFNSRRVSALQEGHDQTGEVSATELQEARLLTFSSEKAAIRDCNFYIIAVPTPIDQNKKPDLRHILEASNHVGTFLKEGDIVVYESTVFPGCTEEVCVPILEESSGLTFNRDFFCGYSPERINPGDTKHRLPDIVKVVSGSTPDAAETVNTFYRSIIRAGTFMTSSIRVAEAAKVIENSQRDINIAFINELALIFDRLELDTLEVLEAASTKWNFLPFKPGLVGGHCIGVDPFYLTHKAEEYGYHSHVILAGRKINDSMGAYIAQKTLKLVSRKKKLSSSTKILILGITFKEDCSDVRNSKSMDIYNELKEYGIDVSIYDPHAHYEQVLEEYGLALLKDEPEWEEYTAIIVAVSHQVFKSYDWLQIRRSAQVIFDVKGILDKQLVDSRL